VDGELTTLFLHGPLSTTVERYGRPILDVLATYGPQHPDMVRYVDQPSEYAAHLAPVGGGRIGHAEAGNTLLDWDYRSCPYARGWVRPFERDARHGSVHRVDIAGTVKE